jgi:hypothetical protein
MRGSIYKRCRCGADAWSGCPHSWRLVVSERFDEAAGDAEPFARSGGVAGTRRESSSRSSPTSTAGRSRIRAASRSSATSAKNGSRRSPESRSAAGPWLRPRWPGTPAPSIESPRRSVEYVSIGVGPLTLNGSATSS